MKAFVTAKIIDRISLILLDFAHHPQESKRSGLPSEIDRPFHGRDQIEESLMRPIHFRTTALLLLISQFVSVALTQNPPPADTSTITRLEVAKPIERELKGGEIHIFAFSMDAGRFASIVVDQRGIDVAVLLFAPDGKKLAEVDSPNGTKGPEPVSFIARAPGVYQISIASLEPKAPTGRYEVALKETRTPNIDDRTLDLALRVARAKTEAEGAELVASEPDLFRPELAKAIYDQGTRILSGPDVPQALLVFKIMLPIAERLGHASSIIGAYSGMGAAYESLEKHDLAIEAHLKTLPLLESKGPMWLGQGHANVGHGYRFKGDYVNALSHYQKSVELFEKSGDKFELISELNDVALSYSALGDQQTAVDTLKKSLKVFEAFEHKRLQLHTLMLLGTTYMLQGRYSLAVGSFRSSLSIAEEVKWTTRMMDLYGYIGDASYQQGEYARSLESFRKLSQLAETANNPRQGATAMVRLGDVFYSQGDVEQAKDHYQRGLELAASVTGVFGYNAMNNRNLMARAHNRLGAIEMENGNLTAALERYEKSRQLLESMPSDPVSMTTLLNSFGNVYSKMGRPAEALTYHEKALEQGEKLNVPFSIATSLVNISDVLRDQGKLDRALNAATRAVDTARSINQRETLWEAHNSRGKALTALRRTDLALAAFSEAIAVIESLRTNVAGTRALVSYSASVQEPYERSIELLMALHQSNPKAGHDARAFDVNERRRARALLESLREANADIRRGVDPELLQREKDLRFQIAVKADLQAKGPDGAAKSLSTAENAERAAKLKSEIASLTADHQSVEAEIRLRSPGYAALTRPKPLTIKQVQQEVLDPKTLLLEYTLGNERSYLWVVTKSSVTSHELPARAEIEAATKTVYGLLVDRKKSSLPGTSREFATAAAKLSTMVLGPVAGKIAGMRLMVVADGSLQYIPFGSLPNPAKKDSSSLVPLVVSNEVVSLPSASALAIMRSESAARAVNSVAVFADPVFVRDDERVSATKGEPSAVGAVSKLEPKTATPILERAIKFEENGSEPLRISRLPFTRREADRIIAIASKTGSMKVDFDANREAALSDELSRYRIVHFATHGILHSQHPELSGIVLSLVNEKGDPVDGFLRLNDIYNMKLNADLVVLSACQTALGKEVRGEGLIGLTRGFMYAGSPRVVASLWKVDDVATAEFMKIFYQKMLKENMRPAAALREAKILMMKQKRWTSPYYWAAFELQGEWR
jgi:CHAT domain-containing protein